MIHIDHILCPIDYSPHSRRALDYALGIARWYGARVTALHVASVDVPVSAFVAPPSSAPVVLPRVDTAALKAQLDRFVQAEQAPGVLVDTDVIEGPIWQEIVTQARFRAADLVVIGTHGRSSVERMVIGSIAERVLRAAPCPVLTVPRAAPEAMPIAAGVFKRILCPTDFTPASHQALQWALAFAQEADAELLVLHVFEALLAPEHDAFPRSALSAYRRSYEDWAVARLHESVPEASRAWCRVRELIGAGSVHREIVHAAATHDCDVIAMGVGKARGVGDRVFGSTTQQVVRTAECPVLTVREGSPSIP
jgi:nucleotide-binding universal stress UspA family protein